MKILLSNKFFYPRGGDCIHTIQLKQLLEEQGHEVAVFSMQFPKNIENENSEYWPSEVSFGSKSPQKLLAALRRPFGVREVKTKWNKLLNDFQPDVVHLHNIHSQLSPLIAQEAKKRNIPVVWTLHDYKLLCPAYTFMEYCGNVCEDCLQDPKAVIQKQCIKGSKLASYLGYFEAKKWNKDRLQKYTDSFISPSSFLKGKMEEGGFPARQIKHIYNFADDEKFNNKINGTRNNEVVYVGRLSKEKGVETLCKAFSFIEKKSAKLTIIGDGPIKPELEKQFASENINFIGFQPWEVIKEKLGKASFMIIPSEWYENNPLTIIESLALGTPVLGAAIGGIPELIEEGSNGMTFEPGNVENLQNKIDQMLTKNDWDYHQIQDNAKFTFAQDTYYKKLMELYNSVIIRK